MDAQGYIVPLLTHFQCCFTRPGFLHFEQLIRAHMGLLGFSHCVTEVLRLTRWHQFKHWTSLYAFLSRGRYSCKQISQRLLDLMLSQLGSAEELVVALDDTLVKKGGRHLFGLGLYRDPSDKNPGAHRRRIYGHCWVVLALLWPEGPRWRSLGLAAWLFVPKKVCAKGFAFKTKIELAVALIKTLHQSQRAPAISPALQAPDSEHQHLWQGRHARCLCRYLDSQSHAGGDADSGGDLSPALG